MTRETEEVNRIFTRLMKTQCWKKARPVPGRDPDRWRIDAAGNIVNNALKGCLGCLCHEYDHIVPFSRGGTTSLENCQILQTRVNRFKGNDFDDPMKQRGYSCAKQWTEQELDLLEMAIYGDVIRDTLRCRCKSVFEQFETSYTQSTSNPIPKKARDMPGCE